jgi:septum formation protein
MSGTRKDHPKGFPKLILASASPRRQELLRQLGVEFEVIPSSVKEIHRNQMTGSELAQINACRKARAVALEHRTALVLGADTLVCLGTEILGKPATGVEAVHMLQRLQGATHQVVTAICLLRVQPHRQQLLVESTEVAFRPLEPAEIRRYLAAINPLDKAGGYAIQEHGDWIVERIAGSYSNVVGLPLERLAAALRDWSTVPQ